MGDLVISGDYLLRLSLILCHNNDTNNDDADANRATTGYAVSFFNKTPIHCRTTQQPAVHSERHRDLDDLQDDSENRAVRYGTFEGIAPSFSLLFESKWCWTQHHLTGPD